MLNMDFSINVRFSGFRVKCGTAQLQDNICMRPKHASHMSQTHPARVPDTSHMHSGRIPHLAKVGGRDS